MPAGILPPKRENPFAQVQPRYLDNVHRQERNFTPPPQPTYETQRAWAGVQPRYMDIKHPDKRVDPHPPPDVSDPLSSWREADEHRALAKRSFAGVASRYEENAEKRGRFENGQKSPRDLVVHKDEMTKIEKGWRHTHALNAHTTFDVMYARWLKKHKDDVFMKRKRNNSRSPVGDYVRHGTPIESTSRGVSPRGGSARPNGTESPQPGSHQRFRSPSTRNMYQPGAPSRGGNSPRPWERTQSPDSYLAGNWHAAGTALCDFDTLKKRTMKKQPQYALAEQHAADVMEHMREAHKEPGFVPRVAYKALYYQIPQRLSSESRAGSNVRAYSIGGGDGENGHASSRHNSPGAAARSATRRL